MESIKLLVLTIFLSLLSTTMSQSSDADLDMQLQLDMFQKTHDRFDCVDIHKQDAFDNPLLKDHSIQMEPSSDIIPKEELSTLTTNNAEPPLTKLQCPEGTVPIRKNPKKDSLQSDSLSLLSGINSKIQDEKELVEHVAALSMKKRNTGVNGVLNVWEPEVVADQFSSAFIFVASQDGPVNNMIVAGWAVNTYDYPATQNYTALYAYWTRDSGKTTGCVDTICQGFVQVNRDISLGMRLQDTSKYDVMRQYSIPLSIKQDGVSKNWWLFYKTEAIGYYPKELFTTLAKEATHGGWGGQVDSPPNVPAPAMGSGIFPGGNGQVCYIEKMMLFDNKHAPVYPHISKLQEHNTNSQCFEIIYAGNKGLHDGHYLLLGGRPGCRG
ncbi:hypothetical protein RND81_06G244500 [Saponaria officinalis]|uniref:Neprosin PEP catalytic domain-containing protein n=1 Tax=Saponaria officinalis TaxID=3572 RepID=A0AAW1KF43_SAPOF